MKSQRLAQWLQEHTQMLGTTPIEQENTLHVTLYECIIDVARGDDTGMLDSILESAAAHAVATNRELTKLLAVPERLRERIWQRISEEIDPEPAFAMLSAVDKIFVHIVKFTIDAYIRASRKANAAQAAEISQLYTESEQKVMRYASEVARANRELARLEQAKTDFISIAAHELKTPLTLIQGYVNILRAMPLDEKVGSMMQGIARGAERMNTIIEDMLDLSAMDMKQLGLVFEEVNLHKTVDLIVAQLNNALKERKQTIAVEELEPLPLIEADSRRVYQIFRQLLSNAIKYTPDGGHIAVSGRLLEGGQNGANRVEVTISDTGVGIAPEDQQKIFEKFYRPGKSSLHSTGQTKFMGAGPGLGLAIVKGLVAAHGGQISADSPGFDKVNYPGSTFCVTLPVKADPAPDVHVQWLNPKRGA